MLRAAVKAQTEVGKQAQAIMNEGKLVSDEIVIKLIGDRIEEPDAAERLHPRRLSAHRGPGQGADAPARQTRTWTSTP